VLRNATRGGDVAAREAATAICQRRFERAPTREELKLFELGSSLRLDQRFYGDEVVVTVRNNSRNLVVTEVETEFVFMNSPPLSNGEWPSDAVPITGLVWQLSPNAQPLQVGRAIGTFEERAAPSRYVIRKSKVTRVLPLQ